MVQTLEQKINGVISYIPMGNPNTKTVFGENVMNRKKPKGYGYVHVKQMKRKRPGRHSKKLIKSTKKRNQEARASRPSQRYRRGLHSLKVGIDLP